MNSKHPMLISDNKIILGVSNKFKTSNIRSLNEFKHPLLIYITKSDWWAQVDSNHRPHAYQACALTG